MKAWPYSGVLYCLCCKKKKIFQRNEPESWGDGPPKCCGLHMKTCIRGQYRKVLAGLIRSVCKDPWSGAEIGVNLGETSSFLLAKFKALSLLSVDVWPRPAKEKEARELLSQYGGRSIVSKMDSVQAAKMLCKAQLDFVYIDADHRYEPVKKDLEAWWPLVRDGGLFCGHDYSETGGYPGVKKAVDEFFKGEVNLANAAIWWVIK